MNRFQKMFERAAESVEYWQGLAAMEFSGGVREMLARRRMSQRELAAMLGQKESYISRVLNHGENLTIKQMQRLLEPLNAAAHILVIDRGKVLEWSEKPRNEPPAAAVGVKPRQVYNFERYAPLAAGTEVPREWTLSMYTPNEEMIQ